MWVSVWGALHQPHVAVCVDRAEGVQPGAFTLTPWDPGRGRGRGGHPLQGHTGLAKTLRVSWLICALDVPEAPPRSPDVGLSWSRRSGASAACGGCRGRSPPWAMGRGRWPALCVLRGPGAIFLGNLFLLSRATRVLLSRGLSASGARLCPVRGRPPRGPSARVPPRPVPGRSARGRGGETPQADPLQLVRGGWGHREP